jgi:hypothetical protein
VAELSLRKVLGGLHYMAGPTLPHGRVLHDYLAGEPAVPTGKLVVTMGTE